MSGIADIDRQADKRIVHLLEDKLTQNDLDSELYVMVSYYAEWELVFDRFEDCPRLQRLLTSRMSYEAIIQQLQRSDLSCRGAMGDYWREIVHRNKLTSRS